MAVRWIFVKHKIKLNKQIDVVEPIQYYKCLYLAISCYCSVIEIQLLKTYYHSYKTNNIKYAVLLNLIE